MCLFEEIVDVTRSYCNSRDGLQEKHMQLLCNIAIYSNLNALLLYFIHIPKLNFDPILTCNSDVIFAGIPLSNKKRIRYFPDPQQNILLL